MTQSITQAEAERDLNHIIVSANKLLKKDWYSRNKLIENILITTFYTYGDANNEDFNTTYNATLGIINTLLEQSNLPLATRQELAKIAVNFTITED